MSDVHRAAPLEGGAAAVRHEEPGIIRVEGADRASWLQGLLTNDLLALAPGHGVYTAWLTPQGRMVTDAVVFADAEALTLEVPRTLVGDLLARLDAAIFAEEVALADETGRWASVGAHGERAAEVVASAVASAQASAGKLLDAATLSGWPEFEHAPLAGGGRLLRHDRYGVPGFDLHVPAADAAAWMPRLGAAGAEPVDAASLEYARIAAGRPRFLVDMDIDTIPLEAGIEDRAISFTKGCYVGQEVIVRVVHRGGGRVARRLVGLAVDGGAVPLPRAVVRHDARDAGLVTSAARTPHGDVIALGYVRREFVEPGTSVAVDCSGVWTPATVRVLPMR